MSGYPQSSELWSQIVEEIKEKSEKSSYVDKIVDDAVLQSDSFAEGLCSNLSAKLADQNTGSEAIGGIIIKVFQENPDIVSDSYFDLLEIKNRDFSCTSLATPFFFSSGYLALQSYRVAHHLLEKDETLLSAFFRQQVSLKFNIDIDPAAFLKRNVVIDHGFGVVIGSTSVVEEHVYIFQNVTLGSTGKVGGDRHPKVKSGVVIGAGATVLGNIEIGEGSVIAAGSVVLKNVPPYKTVAGNPAIVVGDAAFLLQTNPNV